MRMFAKVFLCKECQRNLMKTNILVTCPKQMSVLLNRNANHVESNIGKENTTESWALVRISLFNSDYDMKYTWPGPKNDNVG